MKAIIWIIIIVLVIWGIMALTGGDEGTPEEGDDGADVTDENGDVEGAMDEGDAMMEDDGHSPDDGHDHSEN